MKNFPVSTFGLVLLYCVCAIQPGYAQNPEREKTSGDYADILKRQEEIEKENRRLKEELHVLNGRLEKLESGKDRKENEEKRSLPPRRPVRSENSAQPEETRVGFKPGGKGFFFQGRDYSLHFLGYVQGVGSLFDGSLHRADGNGDFSVRRARFDFIAKLYRDYTLFFEFDAGPGTVASTDSDFAMVEGGMRIRILDDSLQLAAGKFITPFSSENFRSSRGLNTIERYMALNTMFLLPALDSQFGVMLFGKSEGDKRFGYYLGVFNGNGQANANPSDNNNKKEIQAKLLYQENENIELTLGLDYSNEESQVLSLVDLGFSRYVSVNIRGERLGFTGSGFFKSGRWSLHAEGIGFRFDKPDPGTAGLYGGYVQPAYFLLGDGNRGLQFLLRGEVSYLDADTGSNGDTLWAVTPGINWFLNPNVRLQVNGTFHYFDGPSSLRGFDGSKWVPMMQAELQFKY